MTRSVYATLIAGILVLTVGCGKNSNPTTPSEAAIFTAQVSPANEVPPVVNAEASGNGNVTVTVYPARDASGTIISATVDIQVTLVAFPNGTALISAHIHRGNVGEIGNIVLDSGLSPGSVTLVNGSGSFVRTGLAISPDLAQEMMNAPGTFYVDVHSALNQLGMVRGQLIRQQ